MPLPFSILHIPGKALGALPAVKQVNKSNNTINFSKIVQYAKYRIESSASDCSTYKFDKKHILFLYIH